VPGELLGAQDCQSSVSAVLDAVFFLSKLVWNSIQNWGLLFMDIGLPNQAFKQVWNGQMILNRDGMCHEWGPGNTVLTIKDGQTGQRTSQLSPPRTTYFLFWLVGFQTTAKG
jgi:hypothetical protein